MFPFSAENLRLVVILVSMWCLSSSLDLLESLDQRLHNEDMYSLPSSLCFIHLTSLPLSLSLYLSVCQLIISK